MQLLKISSLTNLLNLLFVYIQGSPPLCQLLFPNKPRTQTFLTLQSEWAWEEKLCFYNNSAFRCQNSTKFWIIVMQMSSLFINITNFIRTTECFKKIRSTLNLIFWKNFAGYVTLNCCFYNILLAADYSKQLLYK